MNERDLEAEVHRLNVEKEILAAVVEDQIAEIEELKAKIEALERGDGQ